MERKMLLLSDYKWNNNSNQSQKNNGEDEMYFI